MRIPETEREQNGRLDCRTVHGLLEVRLVVAVPLGQLASAPHGVATNRDGTWKLPHCEYSVHHLAQKAWTLNIAPPNSNVRRRNHYVCPHAPRLVIAAITLS